MEKRSHLLPESIARVLRNLSLRGLGVLFCAISLWMIFVLFLYDPYLSGVGAYGTFGEQSLIGNVVGLMRYGVGFIPTLFLLLCLGRFGVSLFVGWDEERAPEYNFLRGFVTLCLGSISLGLISTSGTFGGLAGAIVGVDFGRVFGVMAMPIGIVLFCLFLVMAGILLHIKWHHVVDAAKKSYYLLRYVLSAFHIIAPIEKEDDEDEEYEEDEEETDEDDDENIEEKPKRRRTPRKKIAADDIVEHEYELPDPELLEKSVFGINVITQEFRQTAQLLQDHFVEFGIFGKIVGIKPGPIVT